ncbi:PhnA domain-containing protein [Halocynthiibacter namhaensis]|uniref:PhnA domain-containing protein n=1 Tax=Halocynthiibacter namhaensis TaxID=1290553 RepID=UPI000578F628|nr:alkylphosphonate utilization protein [Halocynthiibacter namhaensis]
MSATCEICSNTTPLTSHSMAPRDAVVDLCETCLSGVKGPLTEAPHWQCLNEAIWSETDAVKVLAYRLLFGLKSEAWARDLLDIAYLEPDVLAWAEADLPDENAIIHRDSNGVVLAVGDAVVLIKDLPVKGGGFTAKRGTAVRNISLSPDNETHIEGRVNGQQIVILTQFVKKTG